MSNVPAYPALRPQLSVESGRMSLGADHDFHSPVALARPLDLCVIVPIYNERHLVETSLRRLLALTHVHIRSLQVIAVDDGSTDGSGEIVERLQREDPRLLLLRHERNLGKGAAVRTGILHASGDVTVLHDADLEYNPQDLPALLRPFIEEGADAVFGSRYLAAPYRRALMYRHSLMNRWLTRTANVFTDLDLTDVETCYKAVRTLLLKSIPLRSSDFRIEVELTMKLAKRRAQVFEVPIRYLPRSYREGKKIRARDGLLALAAFVRFSVVDDLYLDDEYGSHILHQLERTHRFNTWMADVLRPFVGDRVLEIGAGIGNLTSQFIPRDCYVASDVNPTYLHFLASYATGKPYLHVREVDATRAEHFRDLERQFDTVLLINVLEHVEDEQGTLANVQHTLAPGGRAVILVPQHPALYSSLDEALGHRERYTRDGFRHSLERAGFAVDELFDFNRASVPGWWLNGKLLKRRGFSRVQLKVFDTAVPLLRRIDRLFPYGGQSLIAVARRPD
jgi:glycosyltransferase involved in cell wall biosynthesis